METVRELASAFAGPGLVYAGSRQDTDRYADELHAVQLQAAAYHAGMPAADRDRIQDRFMGGELDVVVATSAFGMGIDKADVRYVVHASAPESLDTYYQQIGRPGRDDEPARIVLFYRPEDLSLQKFLTATALPEKVLDQVIHALGAAGEPLTRSQLEKAVDASRVRVTRAVNLLEDAGMVDTTAQGRLRLTDDDVPPQKARQRAAEAFHSQQELVRSRIQMMTGYAETTDCRRQVLLAYFGQNLTQPCVNCDTCDAGTSRHRDDTAEFPPNSRVRHHEWGTAWSCPPSTTE